MSHIVLWVDGHEARIFHVDPEKFDEITVQNPVHHVHRHPKDVDTQQRSHQNDEQHYFRNITQHLTGPDAILIVGPAATKLHFLRWLVTHAAAVERRVVGVETVDHPSDRQLVAYARTYFHIPA